MIDNDEMGDIYQDFSESGSAGDYRNDVEAYSVFEVAGPVERTRVLDVECGYGRYTMMLAKMGAARVVGVDFSAKMITG